MLISCTCISLLFFCFKLMQGYELPSFQITLHDFIVQAQPSCILVHKSCAVFHVMSRAVLQ